MIRDFGGAFVADVVGLGKSYIGAAIVKHFERTEHARPLIICPATLVDMWERYNEVYQLNARVLSMGFLKEDEGGLPNFLTDNLKYRDRDFLLIDESHNLRHSDAQRYRTVQAFLATGKRCCFLTATPRNKSAWDVYYQIKLFHQDDNTTLPVDPPNLKEYFKLIEKEQRKLPDLLVNLLIRRTRRDILRWYGYDAQTHLKVDPTNFQEYSTGRRKAYVIVGGRHQFFPKRELQTIEYSIEQTYQGLYQELRAFLGKGRTGQPVAPSQNELTYARYGLWHYVLKDKQRSEPYSSLHRAGANLCGLMRVLLFKRFESSVYAFRQSITNLLSIHRSFLKALNEGFVPAGEEAQHLLYNPNHAEEEDLLDALREVSGRYELHDFDLQRLKTHVRHDIEQFDKILQLIAPITPNKDAKLQTLKKWLDKQPLSSGKRIIFTQYADTAQYLFDNLNPNGKRADIEVIHSGDKSKVRVVGRFAPKANPEYKFSRGESEIITLIATDVLAEGLNLQDCDKIINYDLHWNPVRLIQRFGRIDRIGSEYDRIYGFNFLPETGLEKNLGLRQSLRNRIQEIHDTIGEDAKILDLSERLNEETMYAIYEKKSEQLGLWEDEKEELIDLNEAEEQLRRMRKDDPAEYERITKLRDGIRAAKYSTEKGVFVFCEASYPNRSDLKGYQQLFLVDEAGEIVSRDMPRILGIIKCAPDTSGNEIPPDYNSAVMKVQRRFAEEVKHRQAEFLHTLSLTQSQRYVLRELQVLFKQDTDEDVRAQINILERAFREPLTAAMKRELNRIRRNGINGKYLLKTLTDLYLQHNMRNWMDRSPEIEQQPIPRLICSEALGEAPTKKIEFK